jgi:hypothetical protein
MKTRLLTSMKLTRNFASDLIGGVLTTAALFALLCWDFACALWATLVLGRTATEQEGDA